MKSILIASSNTFIVKLFNTYLEGRSRSVLIGKNESAPYFHGPYGVPQGSVIGPLAFTLYSSPLEDIINHHGISNMIYADDTQLYIILKNDERASGIVQLQECLKDIKSWSTKNSLKLNDNKTEVIHFSSRHRPVSPLSSITLNNTSICPVSSARNLGVLFDTHLSLNNHVSNVCRAASFALHRIGSIRQYLDVKSTENLVHSFVMCRIDTCNSLLYGLPDTQIARLQRIQNSAARLVTRTRTRESITPILKDLHWLPIRARIDFKVLVLTYQCIHGIAPVYLQSLVQEYKTTRNLRSSNKSLLTPPVIKTKSYGSRSFQYAAVQLWNSLPEVVKQAETSEQFKTRLKTYLFTLYNNC